MKMNNNQGKMDAKDAFPPLIERVDQQLPHLWGFSLRERIKCLIFDSEMCRRWVVRIVKVG